MQVIKESFIVVVGMAKSARVKTRVRMRVEANKCLAVLANDVDCENAAWRRGLCTKCYYKWRTNRLSLSKENAAQYDAELIKHGYMLDRNESTQIKDESIFSRLAGGKA